MAGRGRGQKVTFTKEQLGITKKDDVAVDLREPPPLYPRMEFKPLPLTSSPTQERLVASKRGLRLNFRDSKFFVKADIKGTWNEDLLRKGDIKRKENESVDMLTAGAWSHVPKELIPAKVLGTTTTKKKSGKRPPKVSSKISGKLPNVLEKLSQLEEKDGNEGPANDAEASDDDEDDESKEKKSVQLNEDEEPVEDEDEELDDGTDYANNYFDNGEDFAEEPDGDDDGPVF